MTRENKVALVVGFALVLLTGILLSDHFSKARADRPADLTPIPFTPVNLISDVAESGELIDVSRFFAVETDVPADPADRPTPAAAITTTGERVHQVRAGESLSVICHRFYGSQAPLDALARYNEISNPDIVTEGRQLRLPPVTLLTGVASTPAAASGSSGAAGTHTIMPGDTLCKIAGDLLGSAARWRELYALNKDVIADPDSLDVDIVLRLPE